MSLTIFIHLFGLLAEPTEGHTVCQKLLLASVKGAIIDSAGPNDLAVGVGWWSNLPPDRYFSGPLILGPFASHGLLTWA